MLISITPSAGTHWRLLYKQTLNDSIATKGREAREKIFNICMKTQSLREIKNWNQRWLVELYFKPKSTEVQIRTEQLTTQLHFIIIWKSDTFPSITAIVLCEEPVSLHYACLLSLHPGYMASLAAYMVQHVLVSSPVNPMKTHEHTH